MKKQRQSNSEYFCICFCYWLHRNGKWKKVIILIHLIGVGSVGSNLEWNNYKNIPSLKFTDEIRQVYAEISS